MIGGKMNIAALRVKSREVTKAEWFPLPASCHPA
jgi:hypothetical protein